jgi:hypothetical protein
MLVASTSVVGFGFRSGKLERVNVFRFAPDCVAKVSEQMLWNLNLKQSNRGACAFESMFPDRARFWINVSRLDGQNTFATISSRKRTSDLRGKR